MHFFLTKTSIPHDPPNKIKSVSSYRHQVSIHSNNLAGAKTLRESRQAIQDLQTVQHPTILTHAKIKFPEHLAQTTLQASHLNDSIMS